MVHKQDPKNGKNKGVIGLITDFGSRGSHYIAAMKSIIFKINPNLNVIDINNHISPFNVAEASFIILYALEHLPSNSIIVCVVDPGVGTMRKILAIKVMIPSLNGENEKKSEEKIIIGPDNGIFSLIKMEHEKKRISNLKITEVREISNKLMFYAHKGSVSSTFHGRDIMSPVAAHILTDFRFEDVGKPIAIDNIKTIIIPNLINAKSKMFQTSILYVDQFGNCILNITEEELDSFTNIFIESIEERNNMNNTYKDSSLYVYFKSKSNVLPIKNSIKNEFLLKRANTFGELKEDELGIIKGSSGFLELCMKNQNTSKKFNLKSGMQIILHLR
ncbi:MAG: SAM hydrolase/SAM-dependent halogenase family protein [Promethearchaeota archaeon]